MLLLLVFLLILLFRFFELTVEALDDVVESLDGALLLPFTLWWLLLLLLLLTIGFVDGVDGGAANAVLLVSSFWLCFSNANRNREREKMKNNMRIQQKHLKYDFDNDLLLPKRNTNNMRTVFLLDCRHSFLTPINSMQSTTVLLSHDSKKTGLFSIFSSIFVFFFVFSLFPPAIHFVFTFADFVLILFGKQIADREFIITIFSNWFGWRWFLQRGAIICRGHVVVYAVVIIIRYTDHNTTANFLVWIIIFIIIIIDLMSGYNWCYQITCRWWCIACAHNWWRWNRVDLLHFRFYQILLRRTKL